MEKAEYIWHRKVFPNEIAVFRREFELTQQAEKAEAVIAAETRYSLWLNGEEVVPDGGLFRESEPGCGWADRIDLAPYVRKGKNLLVIWVHYYGNGGRNNTRLPSGGLSFSCPALGLFSGEGFTCRVHPAFYTPGEPHPSYLYGGDNLGYDARLDPDPGFSVARRVRTTCLSGQPDIWGSASASHSAVPIRTRAGDPAGGVPEWGICGNSALCDESAAGYLGESQRRREA